MSDAPGRPSLLQSIAHSLVGEAPILPTFG